MLSLCMTAPSMLHGDSVATPVNWKPGEEVVVQPFVPTDKARETFAKGVKLVELPSGKEYLRLTPDPSK